MRIFGYVRVSTDLQTNKNQKLAIRQYCRQHRLYHVEWIEEKISGTKAPSKRKLGTLLSRTEKGDLIIVTEISRLGRSIVMIMDILQYLLDKGVKVVAIKEGYELGDDIVSTVLAFAFGLSAQIERTLISERTKQGLERARREGKQIGRKKGQRPSRYKLTGKGAYIARELAAGRSKRSLAIELGVTWSTLQRHLKRIGYISHVTSARSGA